MQKEKTHSTKKTNPKQAAAALKKSDIIELILKDHKPLKKLIKIMKNADKPFSQRKTAFEEFAPMLIAHAKPEEEVLYTFMKKHKKLREEGFEGDVEHALADQLVEECKTSTDKDLVGARIKVLAELVEHHIEEEEEELLPHFKKSSKINERADLGQDYLGLKNNYLGEESVKTKSRSSKQEFRH